jgi:hypothetical protein
MEVLHARCCGLDVHKETVVACLRLLSDSKITTEVRTFQTTTACRLSVRVQKLNAVILKSDINCPYCATAKSETMPIDACQFSYVCIGCGARLRPKEGDCCVFCSHGSVPYPPIQAERLGGMPTTSCRTG